MNKKQEFQFNLMKKGMASSSGLSALDRLVLESDFDEEQEELLYNMLDEFSKKPDFSFAELDRRVGELFGWSYHHVKGLLISLHEDDLYIEVVSQYLRSNFECMGNLSGEYTDIANDLKECGLFP